MVGYSNAGFPALLHNTVRSNFIPLAKIGVFIRGAVGGRERLQIDPGCRTNDYTILSAAPRIVISIDIVNITNKFRAALFALFAPVPMSFLSIASHAQSSVAVPKIDGFYVEPA